MNAFQDAGKKGSINSLLNPQEATTYPNHLPPPPHPVNQTPSHVHPDRYEPTYGPNPTYHLRAADWEDPNRRKAVNSTQLQQHQYHYTQPHSAVSAPPAPNEHTYPPSAPENLRSRSDGSYGYSAREPVWEQHHHPPGPHPSYSQGQRAESSTLSRDYRHPSGYPTYHINQTDNSAPSSAVWQSTDRASVRIAAKNSGYPQSAQSQYNDPSTYYGVQNVYNHSVQSYSQPSAPPIAAIHSVPAQSIQPSGSTTSSSSSKRPLPETEATPAPSSKRAKSKAKVTGSESSAHASPSTAPSKRGYNAKKRSEAAIISAQNDAFQRAQQAAGNELHQPPPGNTSHPVSNMVEGGTYIPELQFARCMSNRYRMENFPRCVSCTRRWAGDTCRFQGIRYFMRDGQRQLCGVSFNERPPTVQAPPMEFPTKWNRKFEGEHATRSKSSIAKALLPTLEAEEEHMQVEEIIRRARESDVRATCDTCMTSLFSTSYMCRMCGREVCFECYQQVRELTEQPENATPSELSDLNVKREKHAHANPFFLSCTKRIDHGVTEFTPVTRFLAVELHKAITQMKEILNQNPGGGVVDNNVLLDTTANPGVQMSEYLRSHPSTAEATLPVDGFPDPLTSHVYDDYTPSNASSQTTSIPIHRAQVLPAALYDPPAGQSAAPARAFSKLWRNGLPLLVKDILPRFKLPWTPQYFMERYGEKNCLVVECQNDTVKRVNIQEFFGWFGQYEGRTECWKLKDWPPTADFKSAFPDLYKDFSEAVPVPDYVRRDGVFNLGSHFPSNAVGPDLGPKMYNSMASSQEVGSKGSTRLHMDMADALNVMLHAEPCPDGTEGYAVWDLYRAEDSGHIRNFLKKRMAMMAQQQAAADPKANNSSKKGRDTASAATDKAASAVQMAGHDPIHSQQFYLDVELRRLLFEETGVKSYRIYQRPGDGVFIPAGCAHQVANMSDCMKIAIDFVSPENIDRCEQLTKEFREQNQSKLWKEDVLQLKTMMWFAWQSSCAQEEVLAKEREALDTSANPSSTHPALTGEAPLTR